MLLEVLVVVTVTTMTMENTLGAVVELIYSTSGDGRVMQ